MSVGPSGKPLGVWLWCLGLLVGLQLGALLLSGAPASAQAKKTSPTGMRWVYCVVEDPNNRTYYTSAVFHVDLGPFVGERANDAKVSALSDSFLADVRARLTPGPRATSYCYFIYKPGPPFDTKAQMESKIAYIHQHAAVTWIDDIDWQPPTLTAIVANPAGRAAAGAGAAATTAGEPRWVWCILSDTKGRVRYNSVVFQYDLSPYNYGTADRAKLTALENSFLGYVQAHVSVPANTGAECQYFMSPHNTQAYVQGTMNSANQISGLRQVDTGWPPGTMRNAPAVATMWMYLQASSTYNNWTFLSGVFAYDPNAPLAPVYAQFKAYLGAHYSVDPSRFDIAIQTPRSPDYNSQSAMQNVLSQSMQQMRQIGGQPTLVDFKP